MTDQKRGRGRPPKRPTAAPVDDTQLRAAKPVVPPVVPGEHIEDVPEDVLPPTPAELAGLLTADEVKAIRAEAAKQVHDDKRKQAKRALLEEELDKARRAGTPDEEELEVTIDLAGHAAFVRLDTLIYWHGYTYRVGYRTAATIRDIMARTWDHEDDVGGANRNHHVKPRNLMIGPGQQGASANSLMRI